MFTKSNGKIKDGFTLIELLVVIAIIVLMAALSLAGISRAVANAKINKATAEMTSLASTGASIYIDLKSRGYVRLCDYDMVDNDVVFATPTFTFPLRINTLATVYDDTTAPFTTSDFVDLADFRNCWDDLSYAVWQTGTVSNTTTAGTNGPPTIGASVIGWTPPTATLFPEGTPLDPWRHCYGLGWDDNRQVMIIYSAGPDGIMQTDWGTTTAVGDDLLYQFR